MQTMFIQNTHTHTLRENLIWKEIKKTKQHIQKQIRRGRRKQVISKEELMKIKKKENNDKNE